MYLGLRLGFFVSLACYLVCGYFPSFGKGGIVPSVPHLLRPGERERERVGIGSSNFFYVVWGLNGCI
jgi:hypothetical protein